jgi:dynein heavy chain 1
VQLIKRGAIIEGDKKLHNQIRVISLADSSPYETLHSYVSNTVAPYFKSYIKRGSHQHSGKLAGGVNDSSLGTAVTAGTGAGGRLAPGMGTDLNSSNSGSGNAQTNGSGGETMSNSDQFVSNIEKKIQEVELGLLNLQQNIDIPEINLVIHPSVIGMIKKCGEEGRKPKADEFADRIEDADFLNQLQKGVSRWVSEIKKVYLKKKLISFRILVFVNFF